MVRVRFEAKKVDNEEITNEMEMKNRRSEISRNKNLKKVELKRSERRQERPEEGEEVAN